MSVQRFKEASSYHYHALLLQALINNAVWITSGAVYVPVKLINEKCLKAAPQYRAEKIPWEAVGVPRQPARLTQQCMKTTVLFCI